LPETFALFKNIGATVMLFMFAIFTPRAARQLEGFYSLAARIRLQVLLAYAFVFITMSILNSPPEFFEIEHYAKIYPYTFIPHSCLSVLSPLPCSFAPCRQVRRFG
jgi:hypothetical protein